MRPNDDLRLIAAGAFSFWGAQAASLLFAAACREFFHVAAPSVPYPLVIFAPLCHPCVPRIPGDVEKFFMQITFRSYHPIKRFRFPHRLIGLLSLVNSSRRERLDAM